MPDMKAFTSGVAGIATGGPLVGVANSLLSASGAVVSSGVTSKVVPVVFVVTIGPGVVPAASKYVRGDKGVMPSD